MLKTGPKKPGCVCPGIWMVAQFRTLRAYLIRTAINIGIDEYRSRSAHGEETVLDDVVVADVAPGVDAHLLGKERLERVWQCMERMPERTREIFLAHLGRGSHLC